MPIIQNRYISTLLAVLPALVLTMWTIPDPVTGNLKQTAWVLWPIFGASNQMLAALTLMILTIYFWRRKKPVLPLLLPMLFIMVITFTSLIMKTQAFYAEGNMLLMSIDLIMIGLIIWMLIEGILVVQNNLRIKK